MRAIECPCTGEASPLTLSEVAPPRKLRPREVAIDVHYSGVNRADLAQRAGRYPAPPGEDTRLGLEVSGVIRAVGSDVSHWNVGDHVMALLAGGGYANEVVADERLLLPVPGGMSLEEAAAVPEAFLTAYLNVFGVGALRKGEAVLIHAGASGVGTAALQLLRGFAGRVFATVGSARKASAIEAFGAEPILRHEGNFADAVLVKAPEGVDVILDVAGGDSLPSNIRLLKADGRLVCIGLLGAREGTLDLGRLLSKRLRVLGSTLRALPIERKAEIITHFRADRFGDLERRTILPLVDSVYAAEHAEEAHKRMASNENVGKILLHWGRHEN